VPQDEYNERRGKVISLHSHQAAEAALERLAQVHSGDVDYRRLLAEAAALGPPVLAAIVRRLDASQPQLLSLFRDLLDRYPVRAQVREALLRAAGDPRGSDYRRLGALLLLYDLGLQLASTEDFLSSLPSFQGLGGAVAQALARSLDGLYGLPHAMDERAGYLFTLLSLPVDILYSALTALSTLEEEGAILALRLLALYPHPDIMAGALDVLVTRASEARTRSLAVLEPNLPPESAAVASRALYKARLSGAYSSDLLLAPDDRCRALLSAIDDVGRRVLWLQVPISPDAAPLKVIGLVLYDTAGLLQAVSSDQAHPIVFPDLGPIGTLHPPMRYDDLGAYAQVQCLEVPFGYGLHALREAVRLNWDTGEWLPTEYLLLFPLIWQHGGAVEDDSGVEPLDSELQGSSEDSGVELFKGAEIGRWHLQSAEVRQLAEEIPRANDSLPYDLADNGWLALLPSIIRLAHDEFDAKLRGLYSRRLSLMAEWLRFAGREREASLALSAARTMLDSPPEANLFVLQLVRRGVLAALSEMGFTVDQASETV